MFESCRFNMTLIILLLINITACKGSSDSTGPDNSSQTGAYKWNNASDFGGGQIRGAHAFTIGTIAYVVSGMGNNCVPHNQVWAYNSAANSWSRKNDFPGTPVIEGAGFAINGRGYICLGSTNGSMGQVNECWEYNPTTDSWLSKASFPEEARSGVSSFVINDKAYITGGSANGSDLWEFNPQLNTWTKKAPYPGGAAFMPTAFAVNGKGYAGLGTLSSLKGEFYEYDPSNNTWTKKRDFPGVARAYAIGAGIGNTGIVCSGISGIENNGNSLVTSREVWEYNPAADTWTQKDNYGGTGRAMCIGFVIGSYLYVGTGSDAGNRNLTDFYKMSPVN